MESKVDLSKARASARMVLKRGAQQKVRKRPARTVPFMGMFNRGEKIIVYDSNRVELGEGTFIRQTVLADLGMIAYECEEHTILAKGAHFVKVNGKLIPVHPWF